VKHYRIHRINKKLIHLVAIMLNSNEQICSIYETVLGHVDMSSRKVTEMAEFVFENIQQIMREYTRSELEIPLRLSIKQL
jgi:acyl-CoA thioesterase FadM